MGALRDHQDDDSRPGTRDRDAAEMRDLIRQVQRDNPLTAQEESALLEGSARGEQRLSTADLVQEGSIGLVEAVRTFATDAQGDFGPFAEQLINLRMDDA